MKNGRGEEAAGLAFQVDRKGLFNIVRITAGTSPFRKMALPILAGLVFLGHGLEGHYFKGLLWALGIGVFYWGFSQIMIFLHVFGSSNQTFFVPQRIRLYEDRMLVSSEHSEEEFSRPDPAQVKVKARYLLIPMGKNSLVFLERSFPDPEEFETLKGWMLGR